MSAFRALLRIARRDAARAKGRSALICLMIALPVFAMTFADVIGRTAQPNQDEVITRALGTAQYELTASLPIGSGLEQAPDPTQGSLAPKTVEDPRLADLAELVPPGARALPTATGLVELRTEGGVADVEWTEVAAGDPVFAGRYELLDGRAPSGPGEVLVTPELLERTGLEVGSPLRVTDPAATVVIAGTAREAGTRGSDAVLAAPGTLIGAPGGLRPADTARSVHVVGVPPLRWERVRELNALGVLAYDRDIVADPPPRSAVPYFAAVPGGEAQDTLFVLLAGALLVALSGLEVVLLAGAAFAVGARRQAHALALLAATGASERQVRLVVLAGGLVLGAVAALAGVAGGILAAALARPLLEAWTETAFARFDVRPLELLAVAAFALVTGVLAAVLPARAAARQDVSPRSPGAAGRCARRAACPRPAWRSPPSESARRPSAASGRQRRAPPGTCRLVPASSPPSSSAAVRSWRCWGSWCSAPA